MITVGIDPGYTGAIVAARDGKVFAVHDMPLMQGKAGKNLLNLSAISDIFVKLIRDCDDQPIRVHIERVSAMPGQGVSSMFRFGEGYGAVQGIVAAHGLPIVFIGPQEWKKPLGLIGADKDYARTLAIQTFPELSSQLTRKKDIGRADAIWICLHTGAK